MSRYATPTDLANVLSATALTGISSDKQQSDLDAASSIADSYLGAQFRLPLTAWGSDLTLRVCQIAALFLMQGRGFNPETGPDDTLQVAHDTAVKWLEGVSRGHIKPTGISDTSPAAVSVSRVYSNTPRWW